MNSAFLCIDACTMLKSGGQFKIIVQVKLPVESLLLYICSCLYGLVSLCKSYLRLYFVRICFMYYLSLE